MHPPRSAACPRRLSRDGRASRSASLPSAWISSDAAGTSIRSSRRSIPILSASRVIRATGAKARPANHQPPRPATNNAIGTPIESWRSSSRTDRPTSSVDVATTITPEHVPEGAATASTRNASPSGPERTVPRRARPGGDRSDLIDGEERLLRCRISGGLHHLAVGAQQLGSRFTLRQPHSDASLTSWNSPSHPS